MTVIDQSKAIVFVDTLGVQHVLSLPRPEDCDLSIEAIAAKDVPAGIPYEIENIADIVIPAPDPTPGAVDIERDRRIAAGFTFDGVLYQADSEARENIMGAHKAASDAMMLGAQAGNLAWQQLIDPGAPAEFKWIAADNSRVSMDAPTVIRFGYAALGHKSRHIFAASDLKNVDPIPADFATNPVYWP